MAADVLSRHAPFLYTMNRFVRLLLLVASFILAACGEDVEDSDPIFLNVDLAGQNFNAGSIKQFRVYAENFRGNDFTRLQVSSFDEERGEIAVLDSALSGRVVDCDLVYRVPMMNRDSVKVTLQVRIEDSAGNVKQSKSTFRVLRKDYVLTELAGLTLYAVEGEGRPNGYSFDRRLPIRTSLSASSEIDIVAYVNPANPETLPRRWNTNTDVYFVRANHLNYAQATYLSVSSAYASSVGYHTVTDIANDDILLVGKGNTPLAIIKVQAVYDDPGFVDDRYIINMKPLSW